MTIRNLRDQLVVASLGHLAAKKKLDDATSKTQQTCDLDKGITQNQAAHEQVQKDLAAAEAEYAEALQVSKNAIDAYQKDQLERKALAAYRRGQKEIKAIEAYQKR